MISTNRIIHERSAIQHVQGNNELIVTPDMDEMEHITKIYADGGYTVRSTVTKMENQFWAYISDTVYMVSGNIWIGFN